MNRELNQAIKITGKIIDQWMPMKIGYDHTPGVVICIAVDGVPKYVNAFGVSDIEKYTKLKKDAQFRVASMSKMFTAVSIMQLQEKGKLRLDDKVVEYLPWFKGKSKQTDLSNVTIRQLLSHNAGLFRDGMAQQWVNDQFPKAIDGTITNKAIVFDNATTLKYSNHGYAVLGALIEKVSRESYVAYTTNHIIKPLGVKNTLPDLPDEVPQISSYRATNGGCQMCQSEIRSLISRPMRTRLQPVLSQTLKIWLYSWPPYTQIAKRRF